MKLLVSSALNRLEVIPQHMKKLKERFLFLRFKVASKGFTKASRTLKTVKVKEGSDALSISKELTESETRVVVFEPK